MVFSDSIWQNFPYTSRSIGAYIVFYQGGPINNFTYVPDIVAQSSADSEYNSAYTTGMALENFSMLNNELLNKYPDVVPEQAPIIILDKKSATCMAKSGKDTKHTIHISRRMYLVRND